MLTSGNWLAQSFIVMEKYLNYETPQVEIIEVEVEKGFAASVTSENGNERIIEEYM